MSLQILSSSVLTDAPLAPTCSSQAHGEVVQGVLQALSCARRLVWPHQPSEVAQGRLVDAGKRKHEGKWSEL